MARRNHLSVAPNVALIRGCYKDVVEQMLRTLANSKEGVLVIDAADVVNEATIKKYAPELSLFDLDLVRPVSAFQLKWFVEEELARWIKYKGVETVVIFGMKPLLFDQNVLDSECVRVLQDVLQGVRRVTQQEGSQVVTLTFSERFDNSRDAKLTEALESSVDFVFDLNELAVCAVH